MVFKSPRLKRRNQTSDPSLSQPPTASTLSPKQREHVTAPSNNVPRAAGDNDVGEFPVEISAVAGEGDIESGVEASCSSLPHSAATTSPSISKKVSDGASVGVSSDMMKCKHETNNVMKLCMKIHTKANARKRGIKPVQSSSILSKARDDCKTSRKIPWPIFERRSGTSDCGKAKTRSCLRPTRSNRRSFGNRKPTLAKKVHFKECISVSFSDGVENKASFHDDGNDYDYFDDDGYDDDNSIIDGSRYSDSQILSETGCDACLDMFYQPGSIPALNYSDYNSNSDLYSVLAPSHDEYDDPMECDAELIDNFVYLTDAKDKSNNANACEKVYAGLSIATESLRDSYCKVVDLCTRVSPDGHTSLAGADDDQIIHRSNFVPKKIYNTHGYGCTPISPEINHDEGRDDIEFSFNELGAAAITNLERVMEVVDDVLFPVDTEIRGRHVDVGATSNEDAATHNSSAAARSVSNNSTGKSKWSSRANKGVIANKDAVSTNSIQMSKRCSTCSKAANATNHVTAGSAALNTSIRDDDPTVPWLHKIMEEINNEKFVSWTDLFQDPVDVDNAISKATDHSTSAKNLDEASASKVCKQRAWNVRDESITSRMRNLLKNATTVHKICAGAPQPLHSIEPASQCYFPVDSREEETNNVQPFAEVYDATCSVPKSILLTSDDGHGAISNWRDAVADTVEFTQPSTNGTRIKSQVHTQQQQEIYPPGILLGPSYLSGRFPPSSILNHHSSHGARTQIHFDPIQISPQGYSPVGNTIHDRYCQNMNGEAYPWQGPIVTPHNGIISLTQQQLCPSAPIMSRLPSNVPSINSNLSEVSTNDERDRYSGLEIMTAEQNNDDRQWIIPAPPHHCVGSRRTTMMVENCNSAHHHYNTTQHPHPHLYYQDDRIRSQNTMQQYIHPSLTDKIITSSPVDYHRPI